MSTPRVEIDLDKIRHNTQFLVAQLKPRGINVIGVTKAVCGHPEVARAMLDGGAVGLAESRISNVERLRNAGISCPITLIRPPMMSQLARVVDSCSASYNTEIEAIKILGAIAQEKGKIHNIALLVEMGDLRDGILPGDLNAFAEELVDLPGVSLRGIATNFACFSGKIPSSQELTTFSRLADDLEQVCGPCLIEISGGNSANLPWGVGPHSKGRINELRLGEAILLGLNPATGEPITGLQTDAFTLMSEVIETKRKPEMVETPRAKQEVKYPRVVSDLCAASRSILAIGYQDVDVDGLTFPEGTTLKGATSDHTVVEATDGHWKYGDKISMKPNYSALLRIFGAPDMVTVLLSRHSKPKSITTKLGRPRLSLVGAEDMYR